MGQTTSTGRGGICGLCKRYNELVTSDGETLTLNADCFEDFDFETTNEAGNRPDFPKYNFSKPKNKKKLSKKTSNTLTCKNVY
ncbi:myristylated virion protein [Cercopithecine alphaherpesvirus 9]|uniref:Myristylated virion protein n=1 Tax=Cercopithecine herpesvirus 9 (strain DHV) TaxID=36348 RepID=Q9E1X1_CHV9D|nr:myristylated tegument protein [Cercopithecine alphaherpesvirus 9]AAG27223.1 myristylated virion protein [Cercopithecine alphaherpesvirus 9]